MATLATIPLSAVVLSLAAGAYGQSTVNCTHHGGHDSDGGQHGDSDDDDDDGEDDDPSDQCNNQNGGGGGHNNGGNNGGGGHNNGGGGGGHDNSSTSTGSATLSNGVGRSTTSAASSATGTAVTELAPKGGHFNKASIAGIILGLICLMALAALLFAYVRKRRRERMSNWLESKRDYEGSRAYSNISSDDGQGGAVAKAANAGGGAGTSVLATGAAAASGVAAGALAVEFANHAHTAPSSQQSTPYTDRDSMVSSVPQSAVSVPLVLHPSSHDALNRLGSDISTQAVTSHQPYSSISTPIYGIAYPNPIAGTSHNSHPPSSFPPSLSTSSNYPETSPSSAYESLLINPYDEVSGRRASMSSQRSSLHEDMAVHQKGLLVAQREMEVSHSEAAVSSALGVAVPPANEPPPEYRQFSA